MFFDRFKQICREKGTRPSNVVEAIGMNRSAVTYWKNNNVLPKADVVKKLAEYLNVKVDDLLIDPDEEINMILGLPPYEAFVALEKVAQENGKGLEVTGEVEKLANNRKADADIIREVYKNLTQKKTDSELSASDNKKYILSVVDKLNEEQENQLAQLLKVLFPNV